MRQVPETLLKSIRKGERNNITHLESALLMQTPQKHMTNFTEEQEFLDICFDLLSEGLIDEDQIEAEAHRIMDEGTN